MALRPPDGRRRRVNIHRALLVLVGTPKQNKSKRFALLGIPHELDDVVEVGDHRHCADVAHHLFVDHHDNVAQLDVRIARLVDGDIHKRELVEGQPKLRLVVAGDDDFERLIARPWLDEVKDGNAVPAWAVLLLLLLRGMGKI